MSFESMLNHKCNIYHMIKNDKSIGYNLPTAPSFSYPDEADEKEVNCHFGVRSFNSTITQNEPKNILSATTILTLPIGTDVRINDKIIDLSEKLEYTAGVPKNIRGHHISVELRRVSEQEAL